jgi:hypothetical protein
MYFPNVSSDNKQRGAIVSSAKQQSMPRDNFAIEGPATICHSVKNVKYFSLLKNALFCWIM